ncbi:MAG: oligosaccharide flippase family protein [Patescibacteria group bacterium]|nr:oligosaccharide flippase family protein [Patescibacteria group bacterium]
MIKESRNNDLVNKSDSVSIQKLDFTLVIHKLLKDTFNYIPARIIPAALGVISVAVFTRFFPPNEYGKYMLIFTTTTLLTVISSHWVGQAILRYRAQYVVAKESKIFIKYFFYTMLLITAALIFFAAILYFPFNPYLKDYRQYYVISFLIVVSNVWFNNLLSLLQADLKSFQFSIYTILNSVLKFVLSLLLVLFISRDIIHLLTGYFLSVFLLIVPMIFAVQCDGRFAEKQYENNHNKKAMKFFVFLKQIFAYGVPMIGWFLGAELLSSLDRYMLQFLRDTAEVGIYTCNYNLVSSAISLVAMPLLTAAHPIIMEIASTKTVNSTEYIQNMIKLFSRYFLILSLPILSFFIAYSSEFADVFLGVEFRSGNIILPIILGGLFTWCFAMFGHKGLELRGKTNVMLLFMLLSISAKIVLNFLFAPKFGYIATAISTLVCFLLYALLVYFGTRSDIKWYIPWGSVLRTSVASAILFIVFWVFKMLITSPIMTLIVAGLLAGPFYLLFLRLTNEFTNDEIDFLRKIVKKIKI